MLIGIQLKAHPTDLQKQVLSQWMGCARFIWNAKCEEDRYLSAFARKYLSVGTYAPIDQTFSQYKDDELSPWLKECPSQILRNSVVNWHKTYRRFIKGECGKPKKKKKSDRGSIHLTDELFRFETLADGVRRLFIGTKTNNIGCLSLKSHGPYRLPKSLYITRRSGSYRVAFCYEDGLDTSNLRGQDDNLRLLRDCDRQFLEDYTVGVDRGTVRPVQAGDKVFEPTDEQRKNKETHEIYIKRYQRRLSRQAKGSRRREKTRRRIAARHQKIANIRQDFSHKTSRSLVDNPKIKVIILEDLRTKNMTKKPKARKTADGRWEKNGAKAKAGLNKSILDQGWYQFETFVKYKAYREGKAFFKVPAYQTSQECAACAYTHPGNRSSQADFRCERCGHTDNADHNAARVIKKRAIDLILDPGTGLSKRGVLLRGTGRGATDKTRAANAGRARGGETSKKKGKARDPGLEAHTGSLAL